MRICHLSDLHFGRHDAGLADSLLADLVAQTPDLVVVSGDFTQIGNEDEFRLARAFLDRLPAPLFAVPGNHDVPATNIIRRLVAPYAYYRRYITEDLEPLLDTGDVVIAGLKTSRRARAELNWAHGSISRRQLDRLRQRLEATTPGALRIVVAHHPLLEPEGEVDKPMRRVRRAERALATFAELGVGLVLSGHFHLSYLRAHGGIAHGTPSGLRQAETAPILVAQAASAVSTRLRGHANGYNLIETSGRDVTVKVREWQPGGWTTREHRAAPADPTLLKAAAP
jgi:3',5'-cyclic AMP phosphodiesterase CpdA